MIPQEELWITILQLAGQQNLARMLENLSMPKTRRSDPRNGET